MLRSPYPWSGGCPRRLRIGLRLCIRALLVVARGLIGIDESARRGRSCSSVRSGREDEFPWRAIAQVSKQDQIVCSSVEQVGEYIAWCTGAEAAKNSLVAAQPFHLHAALGGKIAQNSRQAGIIGMNRECIAGEDNLCFFWRFLQQRRGHRGRGLRLASGSLGRCSRWGSWSLLFSHAAQASGRALRVNLGCRQKQDG